MIPHQSHKLDRPAIREFMRKIPYRFRPAIAKRYSATYLKAKGKVEISYQAENRARYAANSMLRKLSEKVKARHLKMGLSASYFQIAMEAKKVAKEFRIIIGVDISTYGLSLARKETEKYIDAEYLPDLKKVKNEPEEVKLAYIFKKLTCEKYWRSALKKQHGRGMEAAGRDMNIVNKKEGVYVTNETLQRFMEQQERNRFILESITLENEEGMRANLQELSDSSVSNPVNRRHELMTRIAGTEQHARGEKMVADFWTMTTPSRMHSSMGKTGKANKSYDGTTPRQAQKFLSKTFGQIRAQLDREEIQLNGIRVAEPHKDGTAHWHAVFFFNNKKEMKKARGVAERMLRGIIPAVWVDPFETGKPFIHPKTGVCWLSHAGGEPGAKRYRFDCKQIKMDANNSAVGYLAKYISKNIDGFALQGDLFEGTTPESMALRVRAWASVWGARQFQFVGSPSVSVWRELRRLKENPGGELFDIWESADSGDWCEYIKQQTISPVELWKVWNDKTGEYGLPIGDQVIGVKCGVTNVVTRIHEWREVESENLLLKMWKNDFHTVEPEWSPLINEIDYQPDSEARFLRPWSPVNNCTEVKKENVRSAETIPI